MAYSKLHSSLVNSSLWAEPDDVRILFITLLASCDKDGVVWGSKPGIERLANIEKHDEWDPWQVLMSPDEHSSDRMRNPENEGRRIEEVSGGFRLLNFPYYRGLRNEDDRREQNRAAQARFKAKNKPRQSTVSQDKPRSAAGKPISDTDADTDAVHEKPPLSNSPSCQFRKPTPDEAKAYGCEIGMSLDRIESWYDHFQANGWKVSGKTPMKDWKAAMRNGHRNPVLPSSNGSSPQKPRTLSFAERDRRIGQVRSLRNDMLKSLTDSRTGEKRKFTPEEQKEHDALTSELKTLDVCFNS